MAFVTKYRSEFTDDFNVHWRTDIQEDAFAGEITFLKAASNPLSIEWYGNDELLDQHIMGSKCTISAESPTSFMLSDLFTSNPLEYKVVVKKAKAIALSGFVNYDYNQFSTIGKDILLASDSTASKARGKNLFPMVFGEKIVVCCTLKLISGEAPYIRLTNASWAFKSDSVQLSDGYNEIELDPYITESDVCLGIANSAASSFALTDITMSQEYDTHWTGFIQADDYSEPYDAPPFVVNIAAVDGLGLLKNFNFSSLSYTERKEISIVIHDILDLIAVTEFTEYVNLYEDTIDDDTDDSLLDQVGIDPDLFADNTCYEALEVILQTLNAGIRQSMGAYEIFRWVELKGSTMYGRTFTDGTTKTATTKSPYQNINRIGENLISSFDNYTFDTFISSGTKITSAIELGASGYAQSKQSFSITTGEKLRIVFTGTLNSGTAPRFILYLSGSPASNSFTLASGINDQTFTATDTGTAVLLIDVSATTNFSTSEIYLSRYSDPIIPSNFADVEGGTLMIQGQGKELTCNFNYGFKGSILKNYDFQANTFDGNDFTNWTRTSGLDIRKASYLLRGVTTGWVDIGHDDIDDNVSQVMDDLYQNTDTFVVQFSAGGYSSTNDSEIIYADLYLEQASSANIYWFDGSAWQGPTTDIADVTKFEVATDTYNNKSITYDEAVFTVTGFPVDCDHLTIRLYVAGGDVAASFEYAKLYFTEVNENVPESVTYTESLNTYGRILEKNFVLGDGYGFVHDFLQYKGALNLWDSGLQISTGVSWHTRGNTEGKAVIELISEELGGQYDRAKHLIDLPMRETAHDAFIDVNGAILDALNLYNNNIRVFAVNRAMYYPKSRDWQLTISEVI